MAEPENFEDDLFADLYADEEDTSKPSQPAPEVRAEPAVVNGTSEVQTQSKVEESDQNGHASHQGYDEHEGDDEIDFNLGNGSGNDYSAQQEREQAHGPGIKEDG
ncbi:MAG: hypothetical protein M1818_005998 [Claussenomyces sp. TS43310]|nr:MAG: hypothetical protein M1818_005998 [Claussenomyces sp. TS43310]